MASNDQQEAFLYIDKEEDGSRLDRVLLRRLGAEKRGLIMRLIRKGNVRLNGKRVKPAQRVRQADKLFLPASLRMTGQADTGIVSLPSMNLEVLFEDEDLLVINKPASMPVHGGSGHAYGVIEILRQQLALPELRLAHRLDRETSGCLLLAKRLSVVQTLATHFREHEIEKTYWAWVSGHVYPSSGRWQQALKKGVLRGGERMVASDDEGQSAKTSFQTMMYAMLAGTAVSLLALRPHSGRTHQLRVHCQLAGHAILGDGKYAEADDLKRMRLQAVRGLALHAWRLRFVHPSTGALIELCAAAPSWWQKFASLRPVLRA